MLKTIRTILFGKSYRLIWLGIGLSLCFLIFDVIFDAYFFEEESILDLILAPTLYELYMRLTVVGIILIFSSYAQVITRRLQINQSRLEQELAERKQVEEQLRNSEERFRSILDNIQDGYFELDTAGNLTFFNPALVHLLGRSAHELMGMNNRVYMAPEAAKVVFETFNRVFRTGIPEQAFDWDVVRPDGTLRSVETSVSLIKAADGSIQGFRGTARDVTERKQAEIMLRESQEKIQKIFDSSPDAIYLIDLNGMIVECNQTTMNLHGYSTKEELLGTSGFNLVVESERQRAMELLGELVSRGTMHNVELTMVRKDGSQFKAETAGSTLFDPSGKPTGLVVITTDITERKRTESALRSSESSYKAVLQSTADGILATDSAGQPLQANDRFVKMWRIPEKVLDSKDQTAVLQYILDQLSDPQGFLDKAQELYTSNEESFDTLRLKDGRVFERLSRPLIQEMEIQGRVWSFRDITERKQAEEKILLERNFSTAVIDSLPGLFYIYDDQGKFLRWNKNVETISGYSSDEILNMSPLDFFEEPDKSHIAEKIQGVFITGQDSVADVDFVSKNKTRRRYSFSGKIFVVEEKRWLIGMAFDITEREMNENKLRFSAQLLDSSADSIMALDLDGNFIYLNEAAWKTRGYTRDEMMALNLHTLDVPEHEKFIQARMGELIEKGLMTFEAAHRCKDGSVIPIEVSSRIIESNGRKVIISASRDITERKQAEEALRNSDLRFRALIEHSAEGINLLGSDGRIKYTSPSTQRILGYGAEDDPVEFDPALMTHPDDLSGLLITLSDLIQRPNETATAQYRFKHKDGSWHWLEGTMTNLMAEPSVQAVILNYRDITERKHAEDEIQKQLDELQRWHSATLGRENRILDLKREVNELLGKAGQPTRYPSAES